jgi:hypothetical protein
LQVLLLCSGGSFAVMLPVMAAAYLAMLRAWTGAVDKLAMFSNCSMTHITHTEDDLDDIDSGPSTDSKFNGGSQTGGTPAMAA